MYTAYKNSASFIQESEHASGGVALVGDTGLSSAVRAVKERHNKKL